MSVNAKQTAVNQAAQIAMNRGQFQPFYYYTANNNNGQTVQLHGYPGMIGMPNNQFTQFAHPQFAYNFYAHAQAQQQHMNGPNNSINQGLLPSPKSNNKKINHHKGKLNNQNSDTHSSDHGLDLNSKTESSGSENGLTTHNSCDLDKNSCNNQTKSNNKNNKKKNKKPSKKVIVIDLPEDLQSIETVTNKCQKYGEILLVRVLKPGKVLPFDLKMYSGKIHDLGQTCCAIIEFESPVAAALTVEAEENNLKCALLQNGADIALYGDSNNKTVSKASSIGNSEHTHGESGICERSNAGTRSESHHSHDDSLNLSHSDSDSKEHYILENKVSKIQINKEITLEKSNKNNIFRPSFLKNKVQQQNTIKPVAALDLAPSPIMGGLLATPGKEFEMNEDDIESIISDSIDYIEEPIIKIINNESKVIAANNGRVTTALNIKLTVNKPNSINRNAIKMDLTKKINQNATDIFNNIEPFTGRSSSPALLSDPSDEFLLNSRFSEDTDDEFDYKTYSRNFLFSLKDCRRASELPTGLPNIPELLPVSRRF